MWSSLGNVALNVARNFYFPSMRNAGEIAIDGIQSFGDTKMFLGAYRLLCGLRAVAGRVMRLELWFKETTRPALD